MKKISRFFAALAILLSDILCAVVAYNSPLLVSAGRAVRPRLVYFIVTQRFPRKKRRLFQTGTLSGFFFHRSRKSLR